MVQSINQPVSVAMIFSIRKRRKIPWVVEWNNTRYLIAELGLLYYYKEGDRLFHVFEVLTKTGMHMKLKLDTLSLGWTLEAVSDGQAE
jgi:hypothetical protein